MYPIFSTSTDSKSDPWGKASRTISSMEQIVYCPPVTSSYTQKKKFFTEFVGITWMYVWLSIIGCQTSLHLLQTISFSPHISGTPLSSSCHGGGPWKVWLSMGGPRKKVYFYQNIFNIFNSIYSIYWNAFNIFNTCWFSYSGESTGRTSGTRPCQPPRPPDNLVDFSTWVKIIKMEM